MERHQITPSILFDLLEYCPDSGLLYWKERSQKYFADRGNGAATNCSTWNKRYSGKIALNAIWSNGYRCGRIFNKAFPAHRVILAMHIGYWPIEVDHIDGNRLNNRIENLREVTSAENSRNMKLFSTNTSGHRGVGFHKKAGKWQANMKVGGKYIHLGLFVEMADAIAARKAAEITHGFHENHGRH